MESIIDCRAISVVFAPHSVPLKELGWREEFGLYQRLGVWLNLNSGASVPEVLHIKHGTARPRECRDNIVTGPGRATPLLIFSCKSRYCPGTFPNTRGVDGIELTASPSRMKYNHAHIAGGMKYVDHPGEVRPFGAQLRTATARSPLHMGAISPGMNFIPGEIHQG